jgi:release factor glutamine methyltransferase
MALRTEAVLWQVLRDATSRLDEAGSLSPRREAEELVAHALGITWSDLWVRSRDLVAVDAIDELVARRASGEPLAYIVGSVSFGGIEIACGPGALVPRPETERLIDVALALIADVDAPAVVDIGTGTGAVAIAIAVHRPDARVIATDVSSDALAWARRNVTTLGVAVELREGDLFTPLEAGTRFDLIVSNPPYIPDGLDLPPDVMAEPDEALFGGVDGCGVLTRLVDEAGLWLADGGALAVEIGTKLQAEAIAARLGDRRDVRIHNDLAHRPRVVSARW